MNKKLFFNSQIGIQHKYCREFPFGRSTSFQIVGDCIFIFLSLTKSSSNLTVEINYYFKKKKKLYGTVYSFNLDIFWSHHVFPTLFKL